MHETLTVVAGAAVDDWMIGGRMLWKELVIRTVLFVAFAFDEVVGQEVAFLHMVQTVPDLAHQLGGEVSCVPSKQGTRQQG